VPTIERDGARIYYEVEGAGPALILGHSLLFDGRMWAAVVPGLARHFRVINVDARCHRHSTGSGRIAIEDLAADWLAILDHEKAPRALLCGLSLGGMTAMRVALRAPERVAAMALLDTSADPEEPGNRVVYRVLAEIQRLVRLDPLVDPIVERKMFGRTARGEQPDLVARGMQMIHEKEPRAVYPALRAVFDRESVADRLAEIRCPTLVLCGSEDAATPPTRSRRIAERIPGASLHIIPRAGHCSVMEQPAEVEKLLVDFFERHASLAA
jgi:pimeloyl-ACP methyl ester carboxylesterase